MLRSATSGGTSIEGHSHVGREKAQHRVQDDRQQHEVVNRAEKRDREIDWLERQEPEQRSRWKEPGRSARMTQCEPEQTQVLSPHTPEH